MYYPYEVYQLTVDDWHGEFEFIPLSELADESSATYVFNGDSSLADQPDTWAKAEVEKAISMDLVPRHMMNRYTEQITRAEFSTLAIRFVESFSDHTVDEILGHLHLQIDESAFTDTKDEAVLAAYAFGIVNGKGSRTFDPNGAITRQEAAVMLTNTAKFLQIRSNGAALKFSDADEISQWARSSVEFISTVSDKDAQLPVMGSTGDNMFSPAGTYTRQQAYITFKRLFHSDEPH